MTVPPEPMAAPRVLEPGALPDGVLQRPEEGHPQVWLLRVSAHAQSLAAGYGLLDEDERVRHTALLRDADRDRYAAAHIGLRQLLGGYLGMAPQAVVIGREACPICVEPHGRPAVPGSDLHFSLSHSGDLVLFAFAAVPVGVDVEELPRAESIGEVAGSLHPDETAELAALIEPEERRAAFARCWCRKEAYLKGTGEGLAGGIGRTYVGTGNHPVPVAGWAVADVPVDAGYAAAVAGRT
jgi:4'-phosphopantetheinyl transferase